MTRKHRRDPVEAIVEDALIKANIGYTIPAQQHFSSGLDFRLDNGIYIECKQMYTPRIEKQMASQDQVIVIQGIESAKFFASLLNPKTTP